VKLCAHVDEAVAAGAKVLTVGSHRVSGTFFEPTVWWTTHMSFIRGDLRPDLPGEGRPTEAEGGWLANDSIYGLRLRVDLIRTRRDVLRATESGAVNIMTSSPTCHFALRGLLVGHPASAPAGAARAAP